MLIYGFVAAMLGIVTMVIRFFQFWSFGVAGSILTYRIRAKAFSCFLRQEVAYFDREENNSSAICARLSSDALAVQQMTGIRLGVGPVPVTIAAIYWRALVLIENGKMTADSIIIVFAFGTFAALGIRTIAGLLDYVGSSLSAAQNFFDLFDRIPAIDSSSTEGQKL
ncbi:unnamed protein product, partial [Rotaria sp. Silwood1]